jgi:osmotically-inducible protein OsmY
VTVDPASGAVTLAGEVSSNADRADAGRLASSVPGVAFVYNEIEVHRSPR